MIATITLNPSIDQHLIVPSIVMDDTNRATEIHNSPGGKGVNVSKVVRELGGPTHAYALIGGFTGEYWKSLLERLDIPSTTVKTVGDTRINTLLTDLENGTQTRVSAPGPKVPSRCSNYFLKVLLKRKPAPYLWALGGSLPTGMKPAAYREIVEALQKNGHRCLLDADDAALKEGIKAKPFMIKPNEHEFQRLMGGSYKKPSDYLKPAQALVRQGIQIVIVSLAAKGALFVTRNESFHLLSPTVKVRSKIGAGDSLIGGLAFGLYKGWPLLKSAKLGIAASASAVSREAPRLCVKSDIPGLVARVKSVPCRG